MTPPRPPRRQSRLSQVLYCRTTPEEKRQIQQRAAGAKLSVSRYLVRSALEGHSPPTREERARVEALLFLLQRATLAVGSLRANAAGLRPTGVNTAIASDLEETHTVLQRLMAGVRGRL